MVVYRYYNVCMYVLVCEVRGPLLMCSIEEVGFLRMCVSLCVRAYVCVCVCVCSRVSV